MLWTATRYARDEVHLIPALSLMKKIYAVPLVLGFFFPFAASSAEKICPPAVFPLRHTSGHEPSPLIRLTNPPAEAQGLRALLGADEFPPPIQAWFRTKSGLLVLYTAYTPDRGHLTGFFKTSSGWRKMDAGFQIECKP